MKNNRLTYTEIIRLRLISERLRELASLENVFFNSDCEKDKQIKDVVRPYMLWFKCEADLIDEILDGKNSKILISSK